MRAFSIGFDRMVENWRSFPYAKRMRGWYLSNMEPISGEFTAELVFTDKKRVWDTIRKRLIGQKYLRVWHKNPDEAAEYHAFITGDVPDSFGRQDVKVKHLQNSLETMDALKLVLGVEPEFPDDKRVNKVTTNITSLQPHSRNKNRDPDVRWHRRLGTPTAWADHAKRRGAEVEIESSEYMFARHPEGEEGFKFSTLPEHAVPTGFEEEDGGSVDRNAEQPNESSDHEEVGRDDNPS